MKEAAKVSETLGQINSRQRCSDVVSLGVQGCQEVPWGWRELVRVKELGMEEA